MGFDLRSTSGEEFWFNNSGWRYLMTFAEAHGFEWPRDSRGEEKDALTADDAAALADAIERGIGQESLSELAKRVSTELTSLLVTPSESPLFSNEPLAFRPDVIDSWRQFIHFARKGGFSIEF
jgi:hypothetical protein